MSKPTTWTRDFERACLVWQARLGLTDWTIRFGVEKGDGTKWAHVDYDVDARQVQITAYTFRELPRVSPDRIAMHEMLHILLADYVSIAANRGTDTHADVVREEHRVIERLLNAWRGKP